MEKREKQKFNWKKAEDPIPFCVKLYEIIITAVLFATFVSVIISLKSQQMSQLSTWDLFNLIYIYGPIFFAFLVLSCFYDVRNLSEYKLPIFSMFSLEDLVYLCCILLVVISVSFLDEILPLLKEATSTKMLAEKIIDNPQNKFILSNLVFCAAGAYLMKVFNKKKFIFSVGLWIFILFSSLLIKMYPKLGKVKVPHPMYIIPLFFFFLVLIQVISKQIKESKTRKEKILSFLIIILSAILVIVTYFLWPKLLLLEALILLALGILVRFKTKK